MFSIGMLLIGLFFLLAIMLPAVGDAIIPGPQDANLKIQAAVTKTATFNGAWLDMGSGFSPGAGGMPMQCIIPVTAADRADSNETYTFKLEESDDQSTVNSVSPDVAVPVSGATATLGTLVAKGFVTKRYLRLTVTLAGTTPSVTYGDCYLNPQRV